MSSTTAIILGTGIAVAAINSAKAFPAFNSTMKMVEFNSTTFSNSTAWTEDLISSNNNSTSNTTNFWKLDQVDMKAYEAIFNNSTNTNATVGGFETYCNATVPLSSVNSTITMPAVNATMPVINAIGEVDDVFPCGKTLSDSFQGPAHLHISTRGPRLTNYDIANNHMHQVSVADITGDGFISNSTIIGSEFLNNADFLYDSEDLLMSEMTSNYTAVGHSHNHNSADNYYGESQTIANNSTNSSIECAHCEDFSHGDDHILDPVTVMSSYISGHMKEHGRMHGLLTIVADVSTEAYNYTVANVTSALHAFF